MNKVLIILAGSPRGGNKTWDSFIKNCKTPLNADLALCTTEKFISDNKLFQEAKYKWISKEYDDWFDYYRNQYGNNLINYFEKGKETGLYTSGLIHFAFKDIILKNYLDILQKYDFIVYSRFDQFYLSHPLEFDKNKIMIPKGEDYFGVCDRHTILNADYAEKFLGICKFIDSKDTLSYEDEYLNCEVTFANHLKNVGLYEKIYRYNRTQFTTALKKDETNWRIPKYKIYFYNNLMLKYPDEFLDSMRNLLKFNPNLIFKNLILILNYFYMSLRINFGRLRKELKITK